MRKIDEKERKRIKEYLESYVANVVNPRSVGKLLKGSYFELWRYRVGKYRVICELDDISVSVLVFRVGHRKDVYRK